MTSPRPATRKCCGTALASAPLGPPKAGTVAVLAAWEERHVCDLDEEIKRGGDMVVLWWFYRSFMVVLWEFYGGFMGVFGGKHTENLWHMENYHLVIALMVEKK